MLFCFTVHAQTETLNWYMDGNVYTTTQCESGNDILLPTTPTKRGYTFKGWASYQPIEYLESTGTQYIDTGVVPNLSDTKVNVVFMVKTYPYDEFLFGAGSGITGSRYWALLSGSLIQVGYGSRYYNIYNNLSLASIYKYDISTNNTEIIFKLTSLDNGDVVVLFNAPLESKDSISTISLFSTNSVQTTAKAFSGRIYSAQIYDNNILVRDFIPVLDPDGVPCMLDRVEGKFYYNAGTGQFIAGPVIGE